jgi:hypothetical protein
LIVSKKTARGWNHSSDGSGDISASSSAPSTNIPSNTRPDAANVTFDARNERFNNVAGNQYNNEFKVNCNVIIKVTTVLPEKL